MWRSCKFPPQMPQHQFSNLKRATPICINNFLGIIMMDLHQNTLRPWNCKTNLVWEIQNKQNTTGWEDQQKLNNPLTRMQIRNGRSFFVLTHHPCRCSSTVAPATQQESVCSWSWHAQVLVLYCSCVCACRPQQQLSPDKRNHQKCLSPAKSPWPRQGGTFVIQNGETAYEMMFFHLLNDAQKLISTDQKVGTLQNG